jgi:hypothetical protein
VESILRDAAQEARTHTSNHVYSLDAMSFTPEQIVREFAQVFDRFGFEGPEFEEEQPRVAVGIAG